MNNRSCDGAHESLELRVMMTCVGVIVVSEHSMPMLMSGDGRIS